MSVSSLRFLHADQTQLDAQPQVVAELEGDDRRFAQDATLDAFDQLIATAVDQSVHLVLLTGNLFAPQGPTLRAIVRLKEGFAILEEEGIQVVVLPEADELEVVRGTPWLVSNNLNDLSPWDRHPATIQCRDELVVSVSQFRPASDHVRRVDPPQVGRSSAISDFSHAFNIAIYTESDDSNLLEIEDSTFGTFNYVGVSGSSSHREYHSPHGTAYAPGALQKLNSDHSFSSGCLFVEIVDRANTNAELLTLRSIQEVSFSIELPVHSDWENLIEKMKIEMRKLRLRSTDRMCIVYWEIHAAGELSHSLDDPSFVNEIVQFIEEDQGSEGPCRICHLIHRHSEKDRHREISNSSNEERELANEYREMVHSQSSQHLENRVESAIGQLRQDLDIDDHLVHMIDFSRVSKRSEAIGYECLKKAVENT